MKLKKILLLIASIIFSLVTVIFQKETNRFGFPVNFLFYRGGHYETLDTGFKMLDWEFLKRSSFRLDLYALNTLLIWTIIAIISTITINYIKNKKSSK